MVSKVDQSLMYGQQSLLPLLLQPACLFPRLVSSVKNNGDTLGSGASCLLWPSLATVPCCLFPDVFPTNAGFAALLLGFKRPQIFWQRLHCNKKSSFLSPWYSKLEPISISRRTFKLKQQFAMGWGVGVVAL